STTEEQESNKDSLVDSSNINLSSLGNMGRGFEEKGESSQRQEQGRIPTGQGEFGGREDNIPINKDEPPGNRDNSPDSRNPSTTVNKVYIGITIFSIVLLIGAFRFIFRSKKSY